MNSKENKTENKAVGSENRSQSKVKRILLKVSVTLLISVLLPLSLLISVPFEVYAVNFDEYVFALSDFFPVCVGFFFLATAVIFFAIYFLPKKAYRVVSAILLALTLMFFIQGNYLNGNLSTIGGDYLEGEGISTLTSVINILIWAVVFVAAIVLACLKDKKNIISYVGLVVAIVLLITQIVAPVSVAVSKSEIFASSKEREKAVVSGERYIMTDKNIDAVSTQSNIYIFVVDRFDESYAEQAYEDDPELFGSLQGFTWFQNHLACYVHTYPAIAQMLTDNVYDPNPMRTKWLTDCYKNPKPLDTLNQNGYSVNLYTQAYYAYEDAKDLPSYVANRAQTAACEIKERVKMSFGVVAVGLYRVFPYYAKRALTIDSQTSNNCVMEMDKDGNLKYLTKELPNTQFTLGGEKGFYFIHTEGCHAARSVGYGADLAIENLRFIKGYIDYLKENGLYENATIVITGDHGLTVDYNSGKLAKPSLTALFVKPSGVGSGVLKMSHAPTSHNNLWATVFQSENIQYDTEYPSVFDIGENDPVKRYLVSHSWGREFLAVTYEITGDANNFDNWKIIDELSLNKELMD